jgi:hypothetical protein
MGMRDDIQADVAEAFDSDLADAVQPFTGERVVAGEYDPVTGSGGSTTVTYTGRGVFGSFTIQELAGSSLVGTGETQGQHILRSDVKLTALQNEVTETPQIDDKINGYAVVNVGQDPASAMWVIQLRRT